MRRNLKFTPCAPLLLGILITTSCQKEIKTDKIPPEVQAKESFFKLSNDVNPEVKGFALEIERQSKQRNFLDYFIRSNGQPLWDESMVQQYSRGIIALIPLTLDKQSINGYVQAQRFQNGKYRFRVFRKDLLAIYGFDRQSTKNAFKVQATINFFDQSIYKKNIYGITDLRQVTKEAIPFAAEKNIRARNFFARSKAAATNTAISNAGSVVTESCMTITDEVEIWFDPDGSADACHCSGNEYYVRTETTTYTFCWTTGGDGGGSGGGGSGDGESGGGGGSGDGGDGSDTEDNHWEYADYVPGSGIVASEANPNLEDDDPDMAYWYYEYEPGAFPPQARPSYAAMYAAYPKDASGNDMPGPEVYQLVGGTPLAFHNADPEHYNNACALRVSRALNYCNVKIPRIQGETFQGSDGKFYFLSAAKLYAWLKATFGMPNVELTNGGTDGQDFRTGLTGKKGLYLMQPNYPALFGATGHATLWDGSKAIGNHDYFDAEGGTAKVALWILN